MGHAAARLVVDVGSAGLRSRGHRLWRTADVVWCCLCGRNTVRRLAGLREECPGGPSNKSMLDNLKAGRAAKARVTDPPIGVPAPLSVMEWEAWRAGQ